MKKTLAFGIAFIFATAPAFALADAFTLAQVQIEHLTAIAAALEAQEAALASGQSIACAALTSAPSVRVGDTVALAWGSVGAMNPADDTSKPMWTQNGVTVLSFDKPGTVIYSFTFYSASGATANCSAKVVVTA
jgi:hypothetical protein